MVLFNLLKVKCTTGFSTGMFDLFISHSSIQFKCSFGHSYNHIGMTLVKHFKTVDKVLLLHRGVNLGHVGEHKETLCKAYHTSAAHSPNLGCVAPDECAACVKGKMVLERSLPWSIFMRVWSEAE
eukprot:86217-Ditylum_brightwellii.AAC.1